VRRLSIPLLAVAALSAAVAGCGTTSGAPEAATAGDTVYLRAAGGRLLAVDPAGGRAARSLPAGQPARGWRTLYTATPAAGGATRVAAVDLSRGRTVASQLLRGRWSLPSTVAGAAPDALSPDGTTLVLARTGPARSSFALLRAGLRARPRVVSLRGAFAYDAIAPAAGLLYLIEERSGDGPGHYRVRVFDLVKGRLRPGVIVAKSELDEPSMSGEPTSRAATTDGSWVFTLYRSAVKGPFVHALGADTGIAICIDLPRAARSPDAAARAWGLALSPAEDVLYAANPALGLIVEIDASDHQVRRTARLPGGGTPGSGPARPLVSADGSRLYVPSARGIEVLDTATLAAGPPLLAGTGVRALAATRGGRRLYAATAGGELIALQARGGRVLTRLRTAGEPAAVVARPATASRSTPR
jgi:DNA-binding beta-propeller fold protein YncE